MKYSFNFIIILLLFIDLTLVKSMISLEKDEHYQLLLELNKLPDTEIKMICDEMEKSIYNPYRCVNNTDTTNPNSLNGLTVEEYTKLLMMNGSGSKNKFKNGPSQATDLNPIILVPGISGSALEAKLNGKTHTDAWYCWKKSSNWFRLWLNLIEITVQKCWFDNLNLVYDYSNNTYSNAPGVDIRPIDFGGIKGVAYLDYVVGLPITLTDVFGSMVKFLKTLGYEENRSLRGAPYDFRLPIESLAENGWMQQFQNLIEETYELNSQKRVNLLAHSMGGMVTLYFLNSMTWEWKEKYIEAFIPIAVPWSGASKALRALITGDSFGIPLISLERMRTLAQTSGGLVQLTPDPLIWDDSLVFVQTPTQNYSISNIEDLFSTLGLPSVNKIYGSVSSVINGMVPNVTTFCIYGYGVPTEIQYNYNKGLSSPPEVIDTSLGDGTVPLESLKYCSTFQENQQQPVTIQEINLAEHVGIIQSKQVFDYLYSILSNQ